MMPTNRTKRLPAVKTHKASRFSRNLYLCIVIALIAMDMFFSPHRPGPMWDAVWVFLILAVIEQKHITLVDMALVAAFKFDARAAMGSADKGERQ